MALYRYAAISSGDNGQVESSKQLLRSNSVSSVSVVPVPTRKRTSSGVFKVDDVSSPLKELENEKETKKETETIETPKKDKIKKIEKNKKIDKIKKIEKMQKIEKIKKIEKNETNKKIEKKIEKNETNKKIEKKVELVEKIAKIESVKNVKCVTAFKESDSWD